MTIEIVPIQRRHVAGFRAVLDSVARERRHLALLEAPAAAQVRRFVLGNIKSGHAQFVALDGEQLVGWCDVIPKAQATLRALDDCGLKLCDIDAVLCAHSQSRVASMWLGR